MKLKQHQVLGWGSWATGLAWLAGLYFDSPLDRKEAFIFGFLLCWWCTFVIRFLKAWTIWHRAVRTGFDPRDSK